MQHIGQHLASVGGSGFLSDMEEKSKSATYDEQNPVGQSPTHQEPHEAALGAHLPGGSMHKNLSGTAQYATVSWAFLLPGVPFFSVPLPY